jgi:hypothetical protein
MATRQETIQLMFSASPGTEHPQEVMCYEVGNPGTAMMSMIFSLVN